MPTGYRCGKFKIRVALASGRVIQIECKGSTKVKEVKEDLPSANEVKEDLELQIKLRSCVIRLALKSYCSHFILSPYVASSLLKALRP